MRRSQVVMISINDTLTPKTGGEYVYKVMKEELLKRRYKVNEVSVPLLLKNLMSHNDIKMWRKRYYQLLLHFRCVFDSLLKRCWSRNLVITSSSPIFPVFGHLVYHQPKAGICSYVGRGYLSPSEKIGWMVHEREKLSPIWCLAKRSHVLHLSNSFFTKRLIKKLYGLDSFVLYPPVRFSSLAGFRFQNRREFAVLVAKPEAASGIMFLSDIVEKLEKNVRFVVVGRADQTGLRVVQNLKKKGLRIDYLGYVSEQVKLRLFHALSHYLHLSLNEPFGITVVEAMASGCIPIAHKSGGVTEYLPEDLLYASSSEAAQKIDAGVGLQDSELKKMLRKTAEKFDEEKFRKKFAMYVKLLDLR